MIKGIQRTGLSLVFLFVCTQANAYIPPSHFILKTWVDKHNGIKAIKLKTLVTLFKNNKASTVRFRETSYFKVDTQVLKSWATDEADQKLYFVEKPFSALSAASKLFVVAHLQDMMLALREKGIPVQSSEELLQMKTEAERIKAENESLARWSGNQVAWVIGTPDSKISTSPQLWFQKDAFLPLRIVFQANDRNIYDTRFETIKSFRDFYYPKTMSVFKADDGMILSSELLDAVVNHSEVVKQSPSGFTALGESGSTAMKDLIQFYYDNVR